jgi:hypothetical protein
MSSDALLGGRGSHRGEDVVPTAQRGASRCRIPLVLDNLQSGRRDCSLQGGKGIGARDWREKSKVSRREILHEAFLT